MDKETTKSASTNMHFTSRSEHELARRFVLHKRAHNTYSTSLETTISLNPEDVQTINNSPKTFFYNRNLTIDEKIFYDYNISSNVKPTTRQYTDMGSEDEVDVINEKR